MKHSSARSESPRRPSHNENVALGLEAQRRLLGVVMSDANAGTEAARLVKTPDLFKLYDGNGTVNREAQRNAVVYGAALRLLDRGELIDLTTMHHELIQTHEIDAAGGATALAALVEAAQDVVPAQVGKLARLVLDYGIKARVWREAGDLRLAAMDGASPSELAERAQHLAVDWLEASADADNWPEPEPLSPTALPPFPVGALPTWARKFTVAAAESIQVPVDLIGICVLGGLSVAAAGRVRAQVKPDYSEPCNFFGCGIGAPSSRKTSALAVVQEPIEEAERKLRTGDLGREVAFRIEARQTNQKRLKVLQDQLAKLDGDASGEERRAMTEEAARLRQELESEPEPAPPVLLTSSATPESLALRMQGQAGRMAIVTDEGSEIIGILGGRYNRGEPNISFVCQAYSGSSARFDRIGRPPVVVANPRLTLLLLVQDWVLGNLVNNRTFQGGGLVSRFVFAYPRDLVGRREAEPPGVPAELREEFRRRIREMVLHHFALRQERVLPLTGGAREVWREAHDMVEERLGDGGDLSGPGVQEWAGKLVGNCIRMAGLVAAAEGREEIDREIMTRAINFGLNYAIPHGLAALSAMGVDPVERDARAILAAIQRNGEPRIRVRELYKALQKHPGFEKTEMLSPGIELLIGRGYVRRFLMPPRAHDGIVMGGRPGDALEVNPRVVAGWTGAVL
jgi:putative DNA primase/helicase